MIHFVWPWLFVLLPLPYLLRYLLPKTKEQENMVALRVPFFKDLQTLQEQQHDTASPKILWPHVLTFLIWLALVTALARPQWLGEIVSVPISGRDILIAIDASGSMEAPDMTWQGQRTDRLTVVKEVARDFIKRREGDRVGLIIFGTGAYLQSPLTYDLDTAQQFLAEAVIGIAGERTAIGDAIGLAVKQVKVKPSERRVMILLTDGSSNAGEVEPIKAAEMAKEFHLQIYTIGIGSDHTEVQTLLGTQRVNPSLDLDEEALKKIASITDGKYFRATNTESLEDVYKLIDQLEPVESDPQVFRPVISLFHWPLSIAFIASCILALFSLPWSDFNLLVRLRHD